MSNYYDDEAGDLNEFFGSEEWDSSALGWEELTGETQEDKDGSTPTDDDDTPYTPKLVASGDVEEVEEVETAEDLADVENETEIKVDETVEKENSHFFKNPTHAIREELEEVDPDMALFSAEDLLREPYQTAAREVFAAGFIPKLFDAKTGQQYIEAPPPEGSVVVKAVKVPQGGAGKPFVNLYCSVSKSINRKETTETVTTRPWKKIAILGAAGVAAVALIAMLSIFVFSKIQESKTVIVPNVSGVTVDRATQLLSESSLSVGTVQEISSLDQPSGVVLSQSPSAGAQVKPQSGITLVVSSGPKTVEVPELVGTTSEQAKNTLSAINLALGATTEKDSEQPVGTVIEQSVAPGTALREGATVDVVVSNGKTAVPSVIGKTLEQASTELAQKGFKVKPTRITQEGPSGTVVAQSPEANTYLAPDSEVEITYTTPPAPTPTPTPTPSPSP